MYIACGSSVNALQISIIFAEIPQISNKNVKYLRNFRKQDAKKNVSLQRANAHKPKQNQFISI